jgi:hypothetical protein
VIDRDGRRCVRVSRGGEVLCELGFQARGPALPFPLPIPMPGFGDEGRDARFFVGRLRGPVALARVDVSVPRDSPLAPFRLDHPRIGLTFARLALNVPAPWAPRRHVPAYAADTFSAADAADG